MSHRRPALIRTLTIAIAIGSGCADDGNGDGFDELPLAGSGDAPVVTELYFKCSSSPDGTQLDTNAVVGDPQGVADVTAVTVVVFEDDGASQIVETLRLGVCSSCVGRNYYDTMYPDEGKETLTSRICAASTWPVDVTVSDQAGHQTKGRLRIAVTR